MGRSPNGTRVSGTYGPGRRTFPSREPSPPRHTLHGALGSSPPCGLSRVPCGPPSHADDSRPHSTPRTAHPTCAHLVTHPGATRPRPGLHACTYVMLRKPMTLNASAKWRHQSRSASSPNYKSVGDEPPSPLQCAAARQPMMALLLGSIEAPIKAYSQPARASEVT